MSARRYNGPMRFFGFVLIAPKYPFRIRFDLLMRSRLDGQS